MNRGKGVTRTLHKAWLPLLAVLLTVLAMPAFALGLGQLTVKSQRGEPLLAEIAIVSNDPGELENLQVRLASPETFARVGLEPPGGSVTGLQFSVALDPQGRPVIRVTSAAPVDESLLTFLLEVDWGQGRLVREYSALLDAPRTVSAPAQPPIDAPVAAPTNAIVREPVAQPPAAAPAPQPVPTPEATQPATPVDAGQASEAPPPSNAIEPTPAPAPAPAAETGSRARPVAATPGEYGPVKVGDTLGKIARSVDVEGHSLDQVMLALLRANPDAFIKGNINLVKSGAVLRMPSSSELSQYNAREARAIVHEQIGQWREMRKPALQPTAVAADGPTEANVAADDAAAKARTADARLEIVPPSGKDARQAGTRSGVQAGGEGNMLQELQQTKETLAARDAEVQDLKAQVAELEKLQHDQQQLIALKDNRLAEAQQALAARQAEAGTQAQQAAPPQGNAPVVWPWAIGALLVVALLAWLLMRRKPAEPRRPAFDTSRLAAGIPSPVMARQPEAAAAAPGPVDADVAGSPTWHAGGAPAPMATPAPAHAEQASEADAGPAPATDEDEGAADAEAAPVGHDRIELARAYIELGDVATARGLLQEVADGGDAAARGEAARLLRELV
jgi:pilus assembly protein FimV